MLTNLLIFLVLAYAFVAYAVTLQALLFGIPQWLDRATAYGDGKLNWAERFMLALYVPAAIIYAAYYDKWPGVRHILPEFWVAIVLGRQFTSADAMTIRPDEKVDDRGLLERIGLVDAIKQIRRWWGS